MITAIDPNQMRQTGRTVPASSSNQDFSVFMGAMAPAGAEGTRQAGYTDQHAAVTQATMTGLSGASAPYSPFLGTTGGIATASYPLGLGYELGGANPATGPGTPAASGGGATPAGTGSPFLNPSQEFLERDYLLTQMHDQSMNMLVLQAQVQDQNRQFTLVSNMLQNRDRTLQNMIQNIGRT